MQKCSEEINLIRGVRRLLGGGGVPAWSPVGVTGAGQKGLGPSSPQGSDLTPCTWSADPLSLPVRAPVLCPLRSTEAVTRSALYVPCLQPVSAVSTAESLTPQTLAVMERHERPLKRTLPSPLPAP